MALRRRAEQLGMTQEVHVPKKIFRIRSLVVILVLIATGWLFYLGLSLTELGGDLGLKPPLWLRESRYLEVVSDIEAGRLVPLKSNTGPFSQVDYADHVVGLPLSHRGLTPFDIVFAEQRKDGRWFVIFPTWHGFHHDMKGYLYCSGPLTSQDFQLNTGWGVEIVLVCWQPLIVTHIRGPWYSIDGVPD
jgi:hypothetical protein